MPRFAALGGIVGPLAFAAAWIVSGLVTAGYEPATRAISDLAATAASTRLLMTAGMVVLGIGLIVDSWSVRAAIPGCAWVAVLVSGVAALGVAAVPLRWFSDGLHAAFAALGYVALALAPALAARPLAKAGRPRAALASILCAVACAGCLAVAVAGSAYGSYQRLGLVAGHVWIVALAVWTLIGPVAIADPGIRTTAR